MIELFNLYDHNSFKEKYIQGLEEYIKISEKKREQKWSANIAVGSLTFLEHTKNLLKSKALKRNIHKNNESFELRENQEIYGNDKAIDSDNTFLWE